MNILNELKKEIGIFNVTNEFIEVMHRDFCAHKKDILSDYQKLSAFAGEYGIHLTRVTEESVTGIAEMYLLSIHASFSAFLNRFIVLDGSPMRACKPRREGETLLDWIIKELDSHGSSSKIQCCCRVCEYYRLIRNGVAHPDKKRSKDEEKLQKLKEYFLEDDFAQSFVKHLDAPNPRNQLGFDDQVLFSKAVLSLAKHIYYDSQYNLHEHILRNHKELVKRMGVLKAAEKREKYLLGYFRHIYPLNQERIEEIKQIVSDYNKFGVLA